jgi:hypothetical protein
MHAGWVRCGKEERGFHGSEISLLSQGCLRVATGGLTKSLLVNDTADTKSHMRFGVLFGV